MGTCVRVTLAVLFCLIAGKRLRPDFLCWVSNVLLFKGEEKAHASQMAVRTGCRPISQTPLPFPLHDLCVLLGWWVRVWVRKQQSNHLSRSMVLRPHTERCRGVEGQDGDPMVCCEPSVCQQLRLSSGPPGPIHPQCHAGPRKERTTGLTDLQAFNLP